MGGLWPLTEKQGIWELKITKKHIFLKRGSFVAAQAENVGSLGVAKAKKWNGGGGFQVAHTHTALIWEHPRTQPLPWVLAGSNTALPLQVLKNNIWTGVFYFG